MLTEKRIVITGLGAITPVGVGVSKSWSNILAGKSGVVRIKDYDISTHPCQVAALIKDFDATQYIARKDLKKMDTFIHYGLAAGIEAFEDSGLEVTEKNAERIGVIVGSGIGGLPGIEKGHIALTKGGPRKVSPFFVPGNIINMVAGNLSIRYGLKGPNLAISTACSTSTHCIGEAARSILYGEADAIIAGGAEMASSPLGMAGFGAARALTTRNNDPEGASRPWDQDRDGFVLGDGAGVLVVEEYQHAKARGAHIYAELLGYGKSGDAYHITSPLKDGEGAIRCMNLALRDAALNHQDVDYINAHGTSTPLGDIAETLAIKGCFGEYAHKLTISSTKSMTGHMLGAAGGVEAVFSILAIRDQVAPPTTNLDSPDPNCDLDYVPNHARKIKIDIALSNSFGFGGTNGTLIFRRM